MRRLRRSPHRETGTVTAFVTIVTIAMLMAAGLVFDGGVLLAARRQAIDQAGAAARAGAQAVDADALRHRERRLDPGAASAAATAHLRRTGLTGSVVVDGDRVRVTVITTRSLTLLRLVGLHDATVTGTGEARIVRGVTQGET